MTMLDNLRPVVTGTRGYRNQYDETKEPKDRLVRHSLGLEDGYFTWRKDVIPSGDPDLFFGKASEKDDINGHRDIQEAVKQMHEVVEYDPEKTPVDQDGEE